jgi:hypothetical protein
LTLWFFQVNTAQARLLGKVLLGSDAVSIKDIGIDQTQAPAIGSNVQDWELDRINTLSAEPSKSIIFRMIRDYEVESSSLHPQSNRNIEWRKHKDEIVHPAAKHFEQLRSNQSR